MADVDTVQRTDGSEKLRLYTNAITLPSGIEWLTHDWLKYLFK